MMESQKRYSPEMWPNATLPTPRVLLDDVYDHGKGWYSVGTPPRQDPRMPSIGPLAHEAHLRAFREVDLSNEQSLADLVGVVGLPVDRGQPFMGFAEHRQLNPDWKWRETVQKVSSALSLPEFPEHGDMRPPFGFHVAEVALASLQIRLLTDHLTLALEDKPTMAVWSDSGYMDESLAYNVVPGSGGKALQDESAEDVAWYHFARLLTLALAPLQPYVSGPALDAAWGTPPDVVGSYSAACALIFNDVIEQLPYQRCADETCGRLFKRQHGRSDGHFSKTVGVRYCTPAHARRQAQRVQRRRAKIGDPGGSNG